MRRETGLEGRIQSIASGRGLALGVLVDRYGRLRARHEWDGGLSCVDHVGVRAGREPLRMVAAASGAGQTGERDETQRQGEPTRRLPSEREAGKQRDDQQDSQQRIVTRVQAGRHDCAVPDKREVARESLIGLEVTGVRGRWVSDGRVRIAVDRVRGDDAVGNIYTRRHGWLRACDNNCAGVTVHGCESVWNRARSRGGDRRGARGDREGGSRARRLGDRGKTCEQQSEQQGGAGQYALGHFPMSISISVCDVAS